MRRSRFGVFLLFCPWPSELQVTCSCVTSTGGLRFLSCGTEYRFRVGNVVPLIFSFFISNLRITFSPRRLALPGLEDEKISLSSCLRKKSAARPNMTQFSRRIAQSIWEVCLCWVREIDRLVLCMCADLCVLLWVLRGSAAPRYHTKLNLASISPLRQSGWIGWMDGKSQWRRTRR